MKCTLPRGDYALLKVTAQAGKWSKKLCVGRPFTTCEIVIDEGIDECEVEIVAEPCDRRGRMVEPAIVLKKATPKAVKIEATPQVKLQPPLEQKPKKKRVKRGQGIALPKSADSTRSQADMDNDERDTGRIECNNSGWTQESYTDDMLQMG